MPHSRISKILERKLGEFEAAGRRKGRETVISGIVPATGDNGPRYLLAGEGGRQFLRMNANSYLGLSLNDKVVAAEEAAVRRYGAGPGAVRFISGTYAPHVELERRLARFHGRPAAMLFSSAYATVMGVLPSLIDDGTAVISDALNHNCIINAARLAQPQQKRVYPHLDMAQLEHELTEAAKTCRRVLIVTDGVFSMRGNHAPLPDILAIARRHDADFPENVLVIVDDSHGVGALGATGRGAEEHTGGGQADLLIATLGKAFGVNGGYVVGDQTIIDYLRETSPFYVYSNPITPGEAAAATAALDIVEGPEGARLLAHLRAMTARFREGLGSLGFETLAGDHPVVPLMVRNTERTSKLVQHLRDADILATGLNYPVVPQGEEEIRFQISAGHTAADIDQVIAALAAYAD